MKKPASRLVHPPAERILPQRFWSSDKLTGSQTVRSCRITVSQFWSSGKLTGSQTATLTYFHGWSFWGSGKLTGSQTEVASSEDERSVLEQWQTDWWSDKRLIRSLHALVLVR